MWKANVYTDKLTVRIIDRDGGPIGQAVSAFLVSAPQAQSDSMVDGGAQTILVNKGGRSQAALRICVRCGPAPTTVRGIMHAGALRMREAN